MFRSPRRPVRRVQKRDITSKKSTEGENKSSRSSSSSSTPRKTGVLDGVIACLEVYTEDGADASDTFEPIVKGMGGKIRKSLTESVTHLIFKNGSKSIFQKALHAPQKIYIVNLLWLLSCQEENRHVEESDYLVQFGDLPRAIKRRKSMEPSKLRQLEWGEKRRISTIKKSENTSIDTNTEESSRRRSMFVPFNFTSAASFWDPTDDESFGLGTNKRAEEERRKTFAAHRSSNIPRNNSSDSIGGKLSVGLSPLKISSRQNSISPVKQPSCTPDIEKKSPVKLSFDAKLIPKDVSSKDHNVKLASYNIITPSPTSSVNVSQPSISVNGEELVARPLKRKREDNANVSGPAPGNSLPVGILDEQRVISSPRLTRSLSRRRSMAPLAITSTIVTTSLENAARDVCTTLVRQLGGNYAIASVADERTSHVIVGANRRTYSLMVGLICGAWILSPDWIFASLERDCYIPEGPYERSSWFPAAPRAREICQNKRRQNQTPRVEFLTGWSVHIIPGGVKASPEQISKLLELVGARVVDQREDADVVLGRVGEGVVSENWLYDSIMQLEALKVESYQL
ncbi:uncharacterized protein VTP21DRAFT_7138 [Calcarisporiella thermophila]|uniref:uncharacterized protein n=1 Tax=Calcarisporiella thermophila TaxID=911321 RepID=UPI0037442BCB